jgi:membrane-bound serine protease (ClpP class)
MMTRAGRIFFWLLLVSAIVAQAPTAQPPDQAPDLPPEPALPQPAVSTLSGLMLPSGSQIAVIPIKGMIYDFTLVSLERRVDIAIRNGASLIVLELDTPGGVAISAIRIGRYIRTIPVPTVAWVHSEAYSAGILIAAACDEIVMSPSSATGDCAPIVPGMSLAPTERAKALSPILAEFRDSAQTNGYDYALFQAMCVLGVEVYLVEKNDGSGERRLVNQVDYAVMVQGQATQEVAPQGGSASPTSGAATQPTEDVGSAALSVTEADRGGWVGVEVLPSGEKVPGGRVHDGKTLLTLNQTRAQDIGLSKATVGSQQALQQHYRAASVVAVPQTWSAGLAGVLTWWWVRAILIVVFLLGAYIEMQAPGLGVPGAAAAVALLALLGAPYIIGLAEVWHILLFLAGFAFLIVEIVLTPAFGLLGVAGLAMMFMGVVLSVVPSGPGSGGQGVGWLPPPEMWDRMVVSMFITLLALFGSAVGFYYITKHFGKIPGLSRLVLKAQQPRGETGNGPPVRVSGDEVLGDGIEVGHIGEAITELRPSGTARFEGQPVDVVSVGPFIDPGKTVRVIEVHGNRIVVEQAD